MDTRITQGEKLASSLEKTKTVEAVVVYGSVARGEDGSESDIDLLIIVRGGKEKVRKHIQEVEERETHAVHYSPLILTEKEVRNNTGTDTFFWRDLFEQGVILFDKGAYARLREEARRKGRAVPV